MIGGLGTMDMIFQQSEYFLDNLRKGRAFLVTGNDKEANVMQIGWGFVGYMWYKPYIIVAVRKSRYSYDILKKNDEFVVSIPNEGEFIEELRICGIRSGRDTDKIQLCGFKMLPGRNISVPSIDGCKINLECKINYTQELELDMLPKEIRDKSYSNDDMHVMIYGEVL